MKLCGVICEFNPFHEGHSYLLRQARMHADAVICLMSGSFVQRGEPAVFDKYTRARAAMENGADAVVALPAAASLQGAPYFASCGVRAAKQLGCDILMFGSECGDISQLQSLPTDTLDKEAFKSGHSWNRAMRTNPLLQSPNNLLGAEYLRALDGTGIQPLTVKRHGTVTSSALRDELRRRPGHVSVSPCFADDKLFLLARYAISTLGKDGLHNISNISEGLENRIIQASLRAADYNELIGLCVSRRYSAARIRRALCCAVLGITLQDAEYVNRVNVPLCVLAVRSPLLSVLPWSSLRHRLEKADEAEKAALLKEANVTAVYSMLSGAFPADKDFTAPLLRFDS